MKKVLFPLLYLSLCGSLVSASPLENEENNIIIINNNNSNSKTSEHQEYLDNISNYVNDYLFNITSKWHSGEITEYINFLNKINEFEFENLKENINYFTTYCNGNLTFSFEEFIEITSLLHTKTEEFDDLIAYYDQNDITRSKETFLSLFYQKMDNKKTSDQSPLIDNKIGNLITSCKQNNISNPMDNFLPLFYEKMRDSKPSDQLLLVDHKVNNKQSSRQLLLTDHKENNEKLFDDLFNKKIITNQISEIVRCTFTKKYFNNNEMKKIYELLLDFLTSKDFIEIDDFDLSNFKKCLYFTEQPRDSIDYYEYVKNAMLNTHKLFNQQQVSLSSYQYILGLFFKLQNNSNEISAFLSNTHYNGRVGFSFDNIEAQIKKLINSKKLKNIEYWEPVFRSINVYTLDKNLFNELFEFIYSHSEPSHNLIAYLELIHNNNDNASTKITNNFLVKSIIESNENQLIGAHHQLKNICKSIDLDFSSRQLIAGYILLAQKYFEISEQLEDFLLNNPQQFTEAMKDIHMSFQKNCAPFTCYENALKLLVKTKKPTDISLFLTCTDYNNASISFFDLENLIEKNISARNLQNLRSWQPIFQLLDIYRLPEDSFNEFLDFMSLYPEPPRSLVYYLKLICRGTKNKITNISLMQTIMKFNKYGEASTRLEEILLLLNEIGQYNDSCLVKYFSFLNQDEEDIYNKALSNSINLYSSKLISNEIKQDLLKYICIANESSGRSESEISCLEVRKYLDAQSLYKSIKPYDLLKEHASIIQKRLRDSAMYNIKNMRKISYNLSFSSLQSIANTILLAQESPTLQKRLNYAIEKLPFYSLTDENMVKVNLRQHLNFVFQKKIPPSRKKIEFKLKKYLDSILKITEENFNLIVNNDKDFNDFI